MLVIKVPIVRVSCGITPNITNEITPTTNTTVRSRLIGLDSFLTILFSFFAFLKIVLSKKLIGTLVRNAIAPPSINGNIIPHMVFSTPSTISNFHRATTRSAVNTISSLIFLIDILLRSTIFLLFQSLSVILCDRYLFYFNLAYIKNQGFWIRVSLDNFLRHISGPYSQNLLSLVVY